MTQKLQTRWLVAVYLSAPSNSCACCFVLVVSLTRFLFPLLSFQLFCCMASTASSAANKAFLYSFAGWMQVCGSLRSSKLPEDNIIKEHRKALKEISSWKVEVILQADKENATLVMDYDRNVRELLKDTSTYLPSSAGHPGQT